MSGADDAEHLAYFQASDSWANDRAAAERSWLRASWIISGVLALIALMEAIALIFLTPLKTVVPYTLLVDRQTGYIQALKPLEREIISPDRALTRSFLAQYVLTREGYDIDSLQDDYRKVALWSAGEARDRYVAAMQPGNPASPIASLPRRPIVEVEIRGISSLSADTALVRFATSRIDPGGQRQEPQPWQAVINYRFSSAAMSAADRLINPLGFQVIRYRRDAEIAPEPEPSANAAQPTPVTPVFAQQPRRVP